jgi:hypothetical protein
MQRPRLSHCVPDGDTPDLVDDCAKKIFRTESRNDSEARPDDIYVAPTKEEVRRGSFRTQANLSPYLLRGSLGGFSKNGSHCEPFPCQDSPGEQGSSRVVLPRRGGGLVLPEKKKPSATEGRIFILPLHIILKTTVGVLSKCWEARNSSKISAGWHGSSSTGVRAGRHRRQRLVLFPPLRRGVRGGWSRHGPTPWPAAALSPHPP